MNIEVCLHLQVTPQRALSPGYTFFFIFFFSGFKAWIRPWNLGANGFFIKTIVIFHSVDPDYSHVVSVAGTKRVTVPTTSNFSEKPKPLMRLQMLSFTESEKILKTAPRNGATYEKWTVGDTGVMWSVPEHAGSLRNKSNKPNLAMLEQFPQDGLLPSLHLSDREIDTYTHRWMDRVSVYLTYDLQVFIDDQIWMVIIMQHAENVDSSVQLCHHIYPWSFAAPLQARICFQYLWPLSLPREE